MYSQVFEVDSFLHFPHKILCTFLFYLIHATWPAHLILPDLHFSSSTYYKTPQYLVLSSLLLLNPF